MRGLACGGEVPRWKNRASGNFSGLKIVGEQKANHNGKINTARASHPGRIARVCLQHSRAFETASLKMFVSQRTLRAAFPELQIESATPESGYRRSLLAGG